MSDDYSAPNGAYRIGYHGPLAIARIDPDPDNERPETLPGLDELAASIAEQGQIEPLLVYPHPLSAGRFLVQAGHRRRAALAQLGYPDAMVVIVEPPASDVARIIRRLLSNTLRADLDPLAEARAYRALLDRGLTQTALARAVGKSQPVISKLLALLQEPAAIQALVVEGKLTPAHVEQLRRIQEPATDWHGAETEPAETIRQRLAIGAATNELSVERLKANVELVLSSERERRRFAKEEAKREVARRDPAAQAALDVANAAANRANERLNAARRAQGLARRAVGDAALSALFVDGEALTGYGWQLLLGWLAQTVGNNLPEAERLALLGTVAVEPLDIPAISRALTRVIPALVARDWTAKRLPEYSGAISWAERRWGLNARLQAALEAAGLWDDVTPATLPPDDAPAPDPDDAADLREMRGGVCAHCGTRWDALAGYEPADCEDCGSPLVGRREAA